MKKGSTLSWGGKTLFLAISLLVSFVGNVMAQIEVSEPDADGVVTITTTEAGQIGSAGQGGGYNWAQSLDENSQAAIFNATCLKIVGRVNATDMYTLETKCTSGWDLLDMGDATFTDKLEVGPFKDGNPSFHTFIPNIYTKIKCTSFVTPKFEGLTKLPAYFGYCFYTSAGWKDAHVLENITITEGYDEIGAHAFDGYSWLKDVKLPNSLKKIDDYAFYMCENALEYISFNNGLEEIGEGAFKQCNKMQTVMFPASLKSLAAYSFAIDFLKDVYFLGKEAPTVAWNAFSEASYMGNNGFNAPASNSVTAGRDNYKNGSHWVAMLHFPAGLTVEQKAKYTDAKREYVALSQDDLKGYQEKFHECGQETSTLTVKDEWGNAKYTIWGGPQGLGWTNKGYSDVHKGNQYVWPSQGEMQRAYITSYNGLLWDGVTKYDEAYRGLHQFVLVAEDANGTTDPKEWTMTKYADGKWHTICLPFNMTKGQMKKAFGMVSEGKYDIRLCKFSKVDRDSTHMKLYFNDEQFTEDKSDDDVVLEAHVSYMIKANVDKLLGRSTGKTSFEGFQIVPGSPMVTKVLASDNETEYEFVGTYARVNMPQYSYFFGRMSASETTSKFWFQLGTTGSWSPYTSVVYTSKGKSDNDLYFDSTMPLSAAKMYSAMGENEDQTTGIEDVTIEAGNDVVYTDGKVYDINGRLVSNHGLDSLSKGIYVVNGKKVVKK